MPSESVLRRVRGTRVLALASSLPSGGPRGAARRA